MRSLKLFNIKIMPNHGYCKNCWWWNRTGKTIGHCIMQSYYPDAMHVADENSYCPDYINREKENKKQKHTLEEAEQIKAELRNKKSNAR